MKKGQLLGLPLVLIFALVVSAFVLFFGIKFVLDLQSEASYVDLLTTIDDIENNIETYQQYDTGSSKVLPLDIPKQVDELFKWADKLKVKDNKKSKYKKLALYYTANGFTIFPEDGYKIEEVVLPEKIQRISATKIRKNMREKGKLK